MSEIGVIKQIIGAVIDVEFEKNNIPQVYEAIKIKDTGSSKISNNKEYIWQNNRFLV